MHVKLVSIRSASSAESFFCIKVLSKSCWRFQYAKNPLVSCLRDGSELCLLEGKMATLAGTYAALRILFSYGPGFLMLMLLDSSIWMQRPDIVDYKNRVRDIPTQHIYSVYDFVSKRLPGKVREKYWQFRFFVEDHRRWRFSWRRARVKVIGNLGLEHSAARSRPGRNVFVGRADGVSHVAAVGLGLEVPDREKRQILSRNERRSVVSVLRLRVRLRQ